MMTDKHIIIGGVDVSECSYYADGKCTNSHMIQSNCKNVAVCYYKEYRRKEQECEKWQAELADKASELQNIEETIKPLMKRPDDLDCYDLEWIVLAFADEFKQLKAENEELKKQLMQKSEVDMFFNTPIEGWSNDACGICPHKAENEQLKEELSVIQHNCNREGCKYYDDDTFKVFYECKAQKALQLSANSITTKYCDLLQTLTEIKEIAEEKANVNDWLALEILQKISECEVEDDSIKDDGN